MKDGVFIKTEINKGIGWSEEGVEVSESGRVWLRHGSWPLLVWSDGVMMWTKSQVVWILDSSIGISH